MPNISIEARIHCFIFISCVCRWWCRQIGCQGFYREFNHESGQYKPMPADVERSCPAL
jgi:hypothetical protein